MTTAKNLKVNISKDELIQIAKEQQARRDAAVFGWKKIGNIAYAYIYADRKTFGEGDNQASAEVVGRLMAAAWPTRYELSDDMMRYRLLPGNEVATVAEVASLYNEYREALEVEETPAASKKK